ncbi:P-loop containing nucleoside triphosphate hydrolase protein [Blastocladiella britannica]|nr:P-loop containing nucleoside triphosphate hydrolase protein [Blastocladiella britannica]
MAANVTRGSRADTVIPYVKPPKDLAWSTHARTKVVSEAVRLAFGFTKCTPEQATIRTALVDRRHDALVQAKTGTGKTLAYLTAALDAVLNRSIASEAKSAIPVLIVVPTRELAEQVFVEGKKLVDEIPGVTMALMTSGGSEKFQEKLISDRKEGQKILVGTPGRILAATKWLPNGQPGILGNSRLFWVHTLIIDEADRMLDPMFQTQVFEILKHMPSHPRVVRTQLFSATYKPELIQFAKSVLRPGFTAVSTIPATDPGTVHSTRHLYAVAPMAAHPALLHALLVRGHREVHERSLGMVGLKVMVFLPTVRMTELYHALFLRIHESDPEGDLPPPYQLHASLSSSARDANARGFRNATRGVLFTSDVSARGVHYPGVQIVVQIGAPASREAYVHRVGRTGRGTDATAAAPGSDVAHGGSVGLLLLSPAERAAVLEMLALDLPLVRADNVNGCIDQLGVGDSVPWNGSKSAREVKHAVSKEAAGLNQKQGLLQDAYLATLGHCTVFSFFLFLAPRTYNQITIR